MSTQNQSYAKVSGVYPRAIFSGFLVLACVTPAIALAAYTERLTDTTGAQLTSVPVQASDGNMYGVSCTGGTNGGGAVVRIAPSGSVSTLYSFPNSAGQRCPMDIKPSTDSTLIGVTRDSVADSNGNYPGSVFKLTLNGTLTTLQNFNPFYLIPGKNGVIFGTFQHYPFVIGADGTLMDNISIPYSSKDSNGWYRLGFVASDGNVYGSQDPGSGANTPRGGIIFKISPSGIYTILHTFSSYYNVGSLVSFTEGSDGNIYGQYDINKGGVFKITPSGTYTELHTFSGADGSGSGTLVQHQNGYLYGTTSFGGAYGNGTIFRISATGSFTLLHSLASPSEGAIPVGLVVGSDGNLYGVTQYGGTGAGCSHNSFLLCGTIFKSDVNGAFTKLFEFSRVPDNYTSMSISGSGNSDPSYQHFPGGSFTASQDGSNFYGAALFGNDEEFLQSAYKFHLNSSTGADLALSATANVATNGDNTFNISVTNNGDTTAAGVTVDVVVPSGMTFEAGSSSSGCATGSNSRVICHVGQLTVGQAQPLSVVLHNSPAWSTNAVLISAYSDISDPNTNNNGVSITSLPSPLPDITLTNSIASQYSEGTNLNEIYNIKVSNPGYGTALGVTVSGAPPAGTTFVPSLSSSGCNFANGIITCVVGSLSHGVTQTVGVGLRLASPQQPASSVFTAATTTQETDTTNNTSSITATSLADLSIGVEQVSLTTEGIATYKVTVSNRGPGSATGVTVTHTLPTGATFIAASSSSNCVQANVTLTCSIDLLAADASTVFTIVEMVQNHTADSGVFAVGSTSTDSTAGNNSSTINSPSSANAVQVPVPLWALAILGAGLIGRTHLSIRRKSLN